MTATPAETIAQALALLRPDLATTIDKALDRAPLEWNRETGRPDLFGIPDRLAYLNWAHLGATTAAIEAANAWAMKRRAEPWRIERRDYFDEVEACRVLYAGLIGTDASNIALVPAASYGIAVAKSILANTTPGRIVVPEGEHYSNFYAWRRLTALPGWSMEIVPAPDDGDWTRAMIAAIGDGKDIAIVGAPPCHWTDGARLDLPAIAAAARKVGAKLVVDATQNVGADAVSPMAADPDFLAVSAYKWLLGPYGLAFLYVHPRYHAAAPIEEHSYHRAGATGRATKVEYTDDYAPGARRFDAGQRSNFATLPHAVAGLAQLLLWTPAAIQSASHSVVAAIEAAAQARGYETTKGPRAGANITALRREGGWPADIGPTLAKRDVHISLRGDSLRISPSLNNGLRDVGRLFDALPR